MFERLTKASTSCESGRFAMRNAGRDIRSAMSSPRSKKGTFSSLVTTEVAPVGVVLVIVAQPVRAWEVMVTIPPPSSQDCDLTPAPCNPSCMTISERNDVAGLGSALP